MHVTVQTKFNYAWGLVKSPRREDQVQGVKLLQGTPFRSIPAYPTDPASYRDLPCGAAATPRVPVLSRTRAL